MAYYNFKTEGSDSKPAYYLGTYNSGVTIDITSRYPNYAQLTSNNFVIQELSKYTDASRYGKGHDFDHDRDYCEISVAASTSLSNPSISYNSSTGKLSFSQTLSVSGGAGIWSSTSEATCSSAVTVSAKVYLLPEIETI